MKKKFSAALIFVGMFLTVATSWHNSESYCVIFPQNGRDIWGVAQRNILIFEEDQVGLIPQVHFEGNASDFGILVPVPARPTLSTVGANVFSEASFMTQPLVRSSGSGCDCENEEISSPFMIENQTDAILSMEDESGVIVVYEKKVGMYQAVVLQATSVTDLTDWLNENKYSHNTNDADLLQDYVAQNWYFVAMKLDTAETPQRIDQWWSATTTPAKITFDYSEEKLTYPLKISAISTNEKSNVLIYTISADPMRFPRADVEYSNKIDSDEAEAISRNYPQFSQLIKTGNFVTKLYHSFSKAEMSQDIEITKSDDYREFRKIEYGDGNNGLIFAGLSMLALGIFIRRRT